MTSLLVLGVVMCGDWCGWRGLEAQGAADCNCPLTWDANSVAWHTPIAGKGHSSPVVAGERVFVTTAETSMCGQLFRPRALQGLAVASLVLGGVAAMLARKQSMVTAAAVAALYGIFAGGLLFTSGLAGGDSPALRYFSWMHGGTALVVGVASAAIFMQRRAWRIGTAVALLVLTGVLWTLRPDPGYYTLKKWDYWTWVTIWPMVVGLLGTIGVVITSQAKLRAAQPVRPTHVWCLAAIILAAASSYVLISLLARRLSVPHTHILYVNSLIFAPYVVGMLLWCGIGFRLRPSPCAPLAIGSVLIGTMGFACVNLGWRPECLRSVVAVDLPTGKTLWKTAMDRGPLIPVDEDNSAATPTPVIYQDRVHAWFGNPGLVCLDFNGEVIWKDTHLPFEGIHGVAASPIVAEGRLIVDSGNAKAPYITCIDPNSGERLWTTPLDSWPGQHGEHRTPLVFEGKIVRWAMTTNTLSAYSLHTGQKVWSWPVPFKRTGEAVASILRDGDRLYLSSRSTMACVAMQNPPCMVWQTPMAGRGPNTASPVLHDRLLYAVSDQGFASCLDAESGELLWMERIGRRCLASPIAAGRFVYFPCTEGKVVVVSCNRGFSNVAENHLEGQIYASPAVVDGAMILRTTKGLWCIREP